MEKIMDGMRAFVVPVQVLEDEGLSVYEKMVYVVLRSFCNPHKSEAWPSIQTISRLSGISRRQVIRTLKALEDKGYITKRANFIYDPETKKAKQTANIYKLEVPGVSVSHSPCVSQTPPPCLTDTPPGDYQAPKQNNDEHINFKNDDDDRASIIESVWVKVKGEISRDQYDRIVDRAKKRKVHNLEAYLIASVETYLSNRETAAAADRNTVPMSTARRLRKPEIPVVSDDGEAVEMSEDQIRHMYELARKLKERK